MYKNTANDSGMNYLNNNNNEKNNDDNIATIDIDTHLHEHNTINSKNNDNSNDNNQLELFNNMNKLNNDFETESSPSPSHQTKFLTNYGSTSSPQDQPSKSLERETSRSNHLKDEKDEGLGGHHRRLQCHTSRIEGVDLKAKRKLIIASILCLVFMIAEIIGGFLSNSLAIATDAAHLLTDFASFMISLFAIYLAGRPATHRLSFGWYRAEVIGALVSVLMIWVITVILVWLAVQRVINKTYEVDANIMLITSGLAIVVNIIMGVQLGHGHSHGGGGGGGHSHAKGDHSHKGHQKKSKSKKRSIQNGVPSTSIEGLDESEPELTKGVKKLYTSSSTSVNIPSSSSNEVPHLESENMNVRAAFIHVLGDMLQSIGVFIAAIIIYCRPDWAIADPICTFIFSIIVLFTTFKILKDALMVLMEGTPNYLQYSEVVDLLQQVEGVQRVHNLRIWALSLSKVALSVHLVIYAGADPKAVLLKANRAVHKRYKLFETTFQIEEYSDDMENCKQCVNPIV